MSTRCNIHFAYVSGPPVANVYRHSDGYPEGVLPDLDKFFAAVEAQTSDTRFSDPSYLAAKFVVWQAGRSAKLEAYDWRTSTQGEVKPLAFLGVGIMSQDAEDAEYIYTVICRGSGRPEVTYREA
jgi:hypothetical protein